MSRAARTPMDIALDLLARRGYSAKEMTQRLRKAGMAPELADEVTGECIRLGLINDEMYARDYAEVLANRGLGGRRIRQELSRRGVAEFAGDAVEELSESETDRALLAARGKMPHRCAFTLRASHVRFYPRSCTEKNHPQVGGFLL